MAPETPISCEIVVKSEPSAIGPVRQDVLAKLKDNNFSKEDIFSVYLALEEAFANAIKHGNKMDPAKKVKIGYSISDEKIEITITDEGGGFDSEAVLDPRCDENLYKPDGRGIFLIRSYMDLVEFNQCGNRLHIVKHKEKKP